MLRRLFSKITKKKEIKKRDVLHLKSGQRDILKSLFELPVSSAWLSDAQIDKIERDSTVTAAKGSRKAHILKKEIFISAKDDNIKKNLENIFNYNVLDSILDIPYQGVGVFEINWVEKDWIFYPKLVERDYKDFEIHNNELVFSAGGMVQSIPEHKAVHAVYKSKPLKPYGQPLYASLFWLVEFKNAGLEFWIELLERFGTPWVIAKTDGDKNDLADEIFNMFGNDGAVLDPEDSIELVTVKDKGDYKAIIEYIDNQIREIILGGNLTGQVKGGSQAAATVHNDIRMDLAQTDANILNNILKSVIESFKELNSITDEITAVLKDNDNLNIDLAPRDKLISDMGYTPTKEYIERTYNILVEDKKESGVIANKKIALKKELYEDELEYQSSKIDTSKTLTFQNEIINIIENSSSFKEAKEKLLKAFPDLNTADIESSLFKNIANASVLGAVEIQEENPDG
jgi:phage gp29-like protein